VIDRKVIMPKDKYKMTETGIESVPKTQHDNIVDNPKKKYQTNVPRRGKRNPNNG
jgi:hypothetical protein